MFPVAFETVTLTLSTAFAEGTTTVSCVEETSLTDVAAFFPNMTSEALSKFVPLIVRELPPARGPEAWESEETVGAPSALLPIDERLLLPPGFTFSGLFPPQPEKERSIASGMRSSRARSTAIPKFLTI